METLSAGEQARAYLAAAQNKTATIPGLAADLPALPVRSVGVVGAGTMGGGIAMNFLNIGIPVVIAEVSGEGLDRGLAVIRRNYETSVKRGTLSQDDLDRRMALLSGTLDFTALSEADLVIEAVYESMAVKIQVFQRLDDIVRPDAILASNTSFLDVNQIAKATRYPERVLGLHFFSPANVMKLLEVVRGEATSDAVLTTAMHLARTIGKIAVLSGVCDGFIANRAMAPRWREADRLVLEGPTPTDVDRVLTAYGFPMGHFAMMDLVGLDVIGRDDTERSVMGNLVAAGRSGQKTGAGYFDYDDRRKPSPSPVAEEMITSFASEAGIVRRAVSDDEILERLLYPVVNESAKILEEAIALRASDIDVALVSGYGWPADTGGPTFWADTVGLSRVVDGLVAHQKIGAAIAVSSLLSDLSASGGRLSDSWKTDRRSIND